MIEMGRAANGQHGVGSGYDAQIVYPGAGPEAIVALYRVRSREWVAMGTVSVGEGKDLDAMARDLANNPGSWDLVWDERDPQTYERLAEQFDHLEALYRAQG